MRTAFIRALQDLATFDERVWLLTADLGYSVLEAFRDKFPDRFLNVGVAEQNMAGLAAGLAMRGKIPFLYSIANFPTFRCLEQIRNDICYHNCMVRIVAVGGGFAYGAQGYTHHGIEDIAVMRALPRMTVIVPGDPVEADLATQATAVLPGPVYLRLGRGGEPVVHQATPPFTIGRSIMLADGHDGTIVTTGGMLQPAVEAQSRLAARGISVRLLSMHTVKPLDVDAIARAVAETPILITVEEHGVTGGLGSAVADALLDMGIAPHRYQRLAVPEGIQYPVGGQKYLRNILIGDIEKAFIALIQK